ncbi:amidase [Pleomassaria siparia CBS 279.74]|uniref:Amidase n=1 Tax=Pleomassaria siparia CBS 279.74 TaxID=1314801 RepID=A0A6G1KF52_9PLEO|nr:amidase [Pleomassaria siparia CBS 279.74]
MTAPSQQDWQTLALKKRSTLSSQIPPEWLLPTTLLSTLTPTSTKSLLSVPSTSGILTAREIDLTENHDATSLVAMMLKKVATSYEVTLAFCKRAAIAQQCVACLTEFFPTEALTRAKECDEYLEREGMGMGELHGLPISVKDSFNIKGIQSTIGYVSFLSHPPASSNSVLIDILLAAGAVFYCKTSLPQTMMTTDSHNNIFGRTLNPHNPSLTAGGSTGGEGALLAMRGSVLGLATDVAGSNRIPALCCGIKSFKPTSRRVPFKGKTPPGRLGSPTSILPVIGPQGRSVRDFEMWMKTVMTSEPWRYDEGVLDVPWRVVEPAQRPLKFGLVRGCAKRPLHPTVKRVLHTTCKALEKEGHQIVPLDGKIPDIWDCAVLAFKYFLLDPKKTPVQHVLASGEPWIPSMAKSFPEELKGWEASLDGLWDMNVERARVLSAWHDAFVENDLNAVIMPGYQSIAVPHDTYGVPAYTVLQNLIDYPAGILPFLNANQELDTPYVDKDAAYEPPYTPKAVEGAPGAVQIMGRPMKDEELVEIMKVVESVLERAT